MAFSSTLIKIFIISLFLHYNNVHSQYSQSPQSPQESQFETVVFTLTKFEIENPDIFLQADASISGGVLKLTKTDQYGKPLQKSVGRATYLTPIHIWDKASGELADFSTVFTFIVNTNNSQLHGDGFTFFIGPLSFELPKNSSGGYLGLFNPETALIPTQNPIIAIEFDSFTNGWDPASPSQYPHVGIDVGSIDSVATTSWPINFVPGNALGEATINYNSELKRLKVSVAYPGTGRIPTSVSFDVDLRSVLPEWVRVGFSAATGELVETHEIINWSFESAL
ncbi:lectin 9-like [Vicia villosa]|uniref:lectin 9-like n=1 Tax=Vicia villosa TaxID=3911 RepID=UPI00273A7DA4|nr:lectin 9-like [Vicia villosa]